MKLIALTQGKSAIVDDDDGSKKNISTYGKGHQAILNMAIGSQI